MWLWLNLIKLICSAGVTALDLRISRRISLIGCDEERVNMFINQATAERDKQSGNKLFIRQERSGYLRKHLSGGLFFFGFLWVDLSFLLVLGGW